MLVEKSLAKRISIESSLDTDREAFEPRDENSIAQLECHLWTVATNQKAFRIRPSTHQVVALYGPLSELTAHISAGVRFAAPNVLTLSSVLLFLAAAPKCSVVFLSSCFSINSQRQPADLASTREKFLSLPFLFDS
ncbi:hypothetical protein CDAR_453511 [Caerostris darwini]|uniref:Uncharacterized protein n=1 Tax=Caerostris darwini TaxID=1538125 RepID=A0AAV4T9G1_9ARAC|nr:hypothetical protein CDAR_453511 [Caerostris darwini]